MGDASKAAACATCGTSLTDSHANPKVLPMPDMRGMQKQRISCDEEERKRLGYVVSPHYNPGGAAESYVVRGADGGELMRLRYEHNARITVINEGPRAKSSDDEPQGFALCRKCNRWLTNDDDGIAKHVGKQAGDAGDDDEGGGDDAGACPHHARSEDIDRKVWLMTDDRHDALVIQATPPEGVHADEFHVTMRHALAEGIQVALNIDESEINGFLFETSENGSQTIVLYETSEGGTGALRSLTEQARFTAVVSVAREQLHEGEEAACERACYECLCNYYNQSSQAFLNRQAVLPTLAALEAGQMVRAAEGGDWETVRAACDNDGERRVLDAMRSAGLPAPSSAQHALFDGGAPIAKPDFYYEGARCAVFVDGSIHLLDFKELDDEEKRKRLKALGYGIVEIRTDDITAGLRELAARLGVRLA